jgi:5-methyltetrahydrofolate--homocysteine methyltransferase
MAIPGVQIIGDRIDSGFRSTRQMYEDDDFAGIQTLAVRQAEAGAAYLNVNAGRRAKDDPGFMADLIRCIQAVVDLPLAFDYPELRVQQNCLGAYDEGKAGGRKPIINSIAETRWEMTEVTRLQAVKIIVMASEQLVNGEARQNKTAADIHETARRCVLRLQDEHEMDAGDIIVDVSISTLAADMEGLTGEVIESVRRIGKDPELAGIHISGGLFNLGQQLPPETASGIKLRQAVENAFLSLTVPHGFDMILGTPWKEFGLLDDDDPVLCKFREIVSLTGRDALRKMLELRKL